MLSLIPDLQDFCLYPLQSLRPLPSAIVTSLNLPWSASDIVTLGDGSETLFDLYTAMVIWDGQYREIYIAESETEPLIGMSLLYRYRLQVDTIEGGRVTIEEL